MAACASNHATTPDVPADASEDAEGVAPRLGAVPTREGTHFGVWAPHASEVYVVGTFNQWPEIPDERYRLQRQSNDTFTGFIAQAKAGDEYQYLIVNGAKRMRKADPRAAQMTNSVGNSRIVDHAAYRWQVTDFVPPRMEDAIVYELHLGTFADEPGGKPGTWKTAQSKLDYLQALGVNMIEVMPVAEFAGDYSWGYNAAHPFAPESSYGSPDDMKAFIDEAHKRGIGVLIDIVHNHYGPSDLAMWCFDLECLGAGGIYFYTDARRESGWGPRPDFGRAEVRDYVFDNARMWLETYHADGLRWDSTVNIRTAAGRDNPQGWQTMQRYHRWQAAHKPMALSIAEDLQGNEWLVKSDGAGGAGFQTQWDAGFFHPVNAALITPNDAQRDMQAVRNAIVNRYDGRAMARVVYTESHDEVANGKQRIPEMISTGNEASTVAKQRSTLGATLVLTVPGIPMLFMGQEFLEPGYFRDEVPLHWERTTQHGGIVQLYRDLIALRKNVHQTTAGLRGEHVNVFLVDNVNKVIAYHRWDQGGAGDDVVVVLNFGHRAFTQYDLGLPRPGTWRVRFHSSAESYDAGFDKTPVRDVETRAAPKNGLGYTGSVGLPAYSAVILSQ